MALFVFFGLCTLEVLGGDRDGLLDVLLINGCIFETVARLQKLKKSSYSSINSVRIMNATIQ